MSLHPTNAMPEMWASDLDDESLQNQAKVADYLLFKVWNDDLEWSLTGELSMPPSLELYWLGWLKHSPANYVYLWRFLFNANEVLCDRKIMPKKWHDKVVCERLHTIMKVPNCETQEDAVIVWPSPASLGYIMFAEAVAMSRKKYLSEWGKNSPVWSKGTAPAWYSSIGEQAQALKKSLFQFQQGTPSFFESMQAMKKFSEAVKAAGGSFENLKTSIENAKLKEYLDKYGPDSGLKL